MCRAVCLENQHRNQATVISIIHFQRLQPSLDCGSKWTESCLNYCTTALSCNLGHSQRYGKKPFAIPAGQRSARLICWWSRIGHPGITWVSCYIRCLSWWLFINYLLRQVWNDARDYHVIAVTHGRRGEVPAALQYLQGCLSFYDGHDHVNCHSIIWLLAQPQKTQKDTSL